MFGFLGLGFEGSGVWCSVFGVCLLVLGSWCSGSGDLRGLDFWCLFFRARLLILDLWCSVFGARVFGAFRWDATPSWHYW